MTALTEIVLLCRTPANPNLERRLPPLAVGGDTEMAQRADKTHNVPLMSLHSKDMMNWMERV
jgi:hypothetical protein